MEAYRLKAYKISDEVNDVFNQIGNLSKIDIEGFNQNGWEPFIKNAGIADETLTKFLTDANQTDKSLEAFKQYPDVVNKTGKAFNFAALGAKALTIAMNAAIFFAITKAIEGVVWVIDQYVNRVKYAKEAMADAKSNFESVKSELEGINSELEANKTRINELNGLPSLTYVEQGELDKLKDATKELERQRDIKNIELKRAAEDLSESNRNAFKKEYGDNSFSLKDVNELAGAETPVMTIAQGGLEGLAAALIKVRQAQEDAKNAGDNEWLDNMVTAENEYRKQLEDNLSTLHGYRDNLNSILNYRSLTEDEQSFYDNLEQGMRLIYQFTDPSAWNQIEFDQIFNNDSLDVTKEKLIELSNAGKLDEKTIRQYSKLNDAIAQTDPILKNGETAVQAFINQIIALARESKNSGETVEKAFTKEDVIANINSLSGGFESLDKIMNSMKGKNPFDYSLLNDKKFTDEFKGMGKAYTDFIETVSSSPKDVNAAKSAFDNLVTTWIDSKGVLSNLTEENAGLATAMLQNMGVANAEEVVAARLRKEHEDLAAQKYYDANASTVLENATMSGIAAFVDEAVAAGVSQQAMAELALEKLSVNDIKIDTASDIDQVIALANAAGASTSALEQLARAKSAFESINSAIAKSTAQLANPSIGSPIAAGLTMATELLNSNTLQQISEAQKTFEGIKNGTFDYQFTLDPDEYKKAVYNGVNSNKPSGSKKDKKDTEKPIDWIERQLKLLKDKRSELVSKISDTYSAFSTATHDQILELDKTLIDEYANAVNQYQQEYDKAVSKISAQNKAKIENGSMSVDTLSGTELENVQSAMDAYDKLAGTQKEQSEAQKTHLDDIKSKYDAISKSIDNENSKLKDSNSILESQMEYYKSSGIVIDSSFYDRLIRNTSGLISNARDTISNKRAELRDLLANGADKSSQEYIDLKSEIADAENNVYALKKAQEEYNNKLLQLPIENMSIIVSMYQDIGNAISNWGNEVEASGKKLDANYYQSLISNGATVIDQLQKQSSLIKDVMDDYEVGSDNWNELYKQLQSVNSEMSSAIQNIRKFNEELLKMPLENISGFSSELDKVINGLSKVQSEQDQVISAVTGAIREQIDLLNEQKEAVNEQKTAEIDALKEKLKLLEKSNEERRLQFDLEQRQYDLERAKNQNINHVIRNGESVYEADAKAVSDAQQALLDSQYNLEKYNLQEQIDKAQESLDLYNDGLQDQIDALQKISDKWSEISNKITQAQNEAKADEILGSGWKDKVLSGNDTALFNTFSGMYANTAEQLKKYQEQIDSTNNIQSLLEDYIASYKSGEITYAEAVKGINGLLSQLNQKMSATDNLQNIFDYLGTVNDTAANADAILEGIQSGLKDTATELLKSLEQYNKNSGMISEYTSSWQQLTNNVSDMLKVLKEVRDNQRDNYDRDDDDDNDNTRYGGGKDGSPGTPGKGDYVNSGPGVKLATSRKDGITRGLVGSTSDSDKEASMKLLGLKKLNPDELPAVLHMGEAVFNQEQQHKLLENFRTAYGIQPNIPDYSSTLNNVKALDRSAAPIINFYDGITIEKCDTPDEFAKGIMDGKLALALGQRLGRR
ncbi:hypothetical protein [Clostridium sp. 3-3]|uniref:hypothetical protein n=1 Tax=Clostridium sp. 3-3 TaxID=2070757 RepID=UPI000CDAA799|nr:hypothetical protein [Clostridium sp. 3-3]POO87853.1 hypothetical protein C1H59_03560 [Clostridium sp. 3-3]